LYRVRSLTFDIVCSAGRDEPWSLGVASAIISTQHWTSHGTAYFSYDFRIKMNVLLHVPRVQLIIYPPERTLYLLLMILDRMRRFSLSSRHPDSAKETRVAPFEVLTTTVFSKSERLAEILGSSLGTSFRDLAPSRVRDQSKS
jgi:hypothetical protein